MKRLFYYVFQNTASPKKRLIRKKTRTTIISVLTFFIFSPPLLSKEKTNRYQQDQCIAYTQKKLIVPGKRVKQVFFVPDEDVKVLLIGLIHMSKPRTKIRIAVYQLTDKDIVEALIQAHHRNVAIEIIVDKSCTHSRYEKITALRKLRIPIHVYGGKYYSIMHNKFFVFDNTLSGRTIVFTGSANATIGGTTRNEENVWIVENKKITDQYKKKFDTLKVKISAMPKIQEERLTQRVYQSFMKELKSVIQILGNCL
jgi:phosphatidylserine/phosphatidylglycerophosphate/cardiolipin synthase-like enzyme